MRKMMSSCCAAKCGDSSIFGLSESGLQFPAADLLPDYDPSVTAQHSNLLSPTYIDRGTHVLSLSFRSWIVQTATHTVLIDTCIGNDKSRPSMPPFDQLHTTYIAQLAGLGLRPEDIDVVCCTHLHADHCGWNTKLTDGRWVPTFPNARYVFSQQELDYWTAQAPGTMGPHEGVYQDSVLPVVEAGLSLAIDGSWDISDELRIRPAPGHTAGHYAVFLSQGGEGAVFCGDVVHHPLQILQPEWNTAFCALPDLARSTRRSILEQVTAENMLLFPTHFAGTGFGRVTRAGESFGFTPGS